jgi:hypothetical protein
MRNYVKTRAITLAPGAPLKGRLRCLTLRYHTKGLYYKNIKTIRSPNVWIPSKAIVILKAREDVKVTENRKTQASYKICPFSVNYESVLFYCTGTGWKG